MKTEQRKWTPDAGWSGNKATLAQTAQVVLIFGSVAAIQAVERRAEIRALYPAALQLGCTTAGEICGTEVTDDALVITAVEFEHSQLRSVQISLAEAETSSKAGELLGQALPHSVPGAAPGQGECLAHVFVLSDGLKINGSELVKGLAKSLPAGVGVTGGLAGDGARFIETLTVRNGDVAPRSVVAVGLYGSRLRVGFSSLGGWDAFGPERLVTRAEGNVLYELDGRSALSLYKKYLGEHAQGLPATGLLFPLSLRTAPGRFPVVRTILNVDDALQSMTFAGDIPEGSRVQLMKATFDRLIDGAALAARSSTEALQGEPPTLAILISCVGRKLVLKQRIEEEVESVRAVLGAEATLAGFYSYGEISPFVSGGRCELHNQTMSITALTEI